MIPSAQAPGCTPRLDPLHARFLALLPHVERHGRIYFRHLRCPHQKADAIQEMRALGRMWFLRLHQRGKDPGDFLTAFTTLLARAGHEHLDSSPQGQGRHDAFEERLRDNTITPVPDQVQFRIDLPAWLATRTARDRRLVRAMANDERTLDLSQRFEVSPGRISQRRREFHDDWRRFCGALASAVV